MSIILPSIGIGFITALQQIDPFIIDSSFITTETNIRADTTASLGDVAYGTDTNSLYIFDGSNWAKFNND
jgi:hypothetical protein